jgi:uncharacterized membrane protein YraQ (UPF0718 family)
MKKILKRYQLFLILLGCLCLLLFAKPAIGTKAILLTLSSFKEMILLLPPIFVLLGLLDVWVPREIMIRWMGPGSGIKGVLLAIFIGSAAAGPLYGAFPIAAVFMKKGVSFSNILIFLGAWSTTKIPMFLFEMGSMGSKFAFTRLAIDIPGIIIIAWIIQKLMNQKEIDLIYEKAIGGL